MREILFRGKRIDNDEWVEGSLISNDYRRWFIAIHPSLAFGPTRKYEINEETLWGFYPFFEVDPETVGQYTGLIDKNGKKIFEGDIVSGFFNHEKIVGYIFYGSDASFFIQRDGLFGIGLNNASDWLEVIGNIHDNPEFLEQIGRMDKC